MSTRTWRFAIAIVALALSTFAISALAHVVPLTERQLAAGSAHVVVAVVEGEHSRWSERRTLIVTDYTLRVEDRLKGDAPERITLTIPGGTVGGETHGTCLSTPLAAGARYLLFLQGLDHRGLVPVTGGWQGAFREVAGPHGKRFAASGPDEEAPLRSAAGMPIEFGALVHAVRELVARVEAAPEPEDTAWLWTSGAARTVEPVGLQVQDGVDLPAEPLGSPVERVEASEPVKADLERLGAGFVVRDPAAAPIVFEPLPAGSPFSPVDQQQMAYWNLYLGSDLFRASRQPTPGWALGNGIFEIAGFPDSEELARELGEGWSPDALSVVTWRVSNGRIVEADIAFNPGVLWTLDEAAATASPDLHSFRRTLLEHLGRAWGYQGLRSLFSIFDLTPVSRDSVMNLKGFSVSSATLYAEDAAAARATYGGRTIRDGLVSPYSLAAAPFSPFYFRVRSAVTAARPGQSFEFSGAVTLENPGTVPLVNPVVEVYLVPRRFSPSGAILLKRIKVKGSVPSGAAREVALGRATVPQRIRPGAYAFMFVLRDAKDVHQANNRAWSVVGAGLTITR